LSSSSAGSIAGLSSIGIMKAGRMSKPSCRNRAAIKSMNMDNTKTGK